VFLTEFLHIVPNAHILWVVLIKVAAE
jgi:hypothetical protein